MLTSARIQDDRPLLERRKESRFTLILRVGVLEQEGRSSLCLVKNISSSGLQLKCYGRPVVDAPASIRVADEAPLRGRVIWIDGEIVGFTFDQELDAAVMLRVQQKLRPNRRRSSPRVNVEAAACLRARGRIYPAAVCDISSMGARIRSKARLEPGDRAILSLSDLPFLEAYVRWSDGDEVGLIFETPIPMQIMAQWIDGRIPITP